MNYIPGLENIAADGMSIIPMIDNDRKIKQSYTRKISTTRGSYARKVDITEEYLLDVGVIVRHQKMKHHQLKEYISDDKSPYTEAKLY